MFTDDELTTDDSDENEDVRYSIIYHTFCVKFRSQQLSCIYVLTTHFTCSFHNLTKSVIEELNAEENMEDGNSSRYDISSCYTVKYEPLVFFLNVVSGFVVSSSTYSDGESTKDSEETESADEDGDVYEMGDEDLCSSDDVGVDSFSTLHQVPATPASLILFGPHRKLSGGEKICEVKDEYEMVHDKKFVCTLSLLLAVFQARCQTPGCTSVPTVKHHFVGMALQVNSTCKSGHQSSFCSSSKVNNIFVNNLHTAASIILSGSHYAKMERFAKFLNLEFLSKSSYYRFQRLYLIPEINDWWCWMRRELIGEFSGQKIVVGGDGQCDSPGFNAKNLCYFIVEVNSNYILDIEVLDKRHVGLISTNMEKEAVKRSLDRLQQDVEVAELVTDASTSAKAFLGKLIIICIFVFFRYQFLSKRISEVSVVRKFEI